MQPFERVHLACYNVNQDVGKVRVDVLGRKDPGVVWVLRVKGTFSKIVNKEPKRKALNFAFV